MGGHPNLLLTDLKVWQGWKESNLRMPESKSGALTNLATPLHGTAVVANNRPINCPFQNCLIRSCLKSRPGLIYQPAKGCTSRLLHLRTRQPPGALAKIASCGNCANTALPEPVILPRSCWAASQSSDWPICGHIIEATGCKSFRPNSYNSVNFINEFFAPFVFAAKPWIVAVSVSRFSSGALKRS